jgi:hypothetical protein
VTGLCYYAARQRIVATLGQSNLAEWDGTSWSTPAYRSYNDQPFRDYDSRRQRPVAFPGVYLDVPTGPGSYLSGGGCGSSNGFPGLTSFGYAHLGDPLFRFEVTTPLPATPVILAIAGSAGSMPLGGTCDWQLVGPVTSFFQVTDARALARFPAWIDANPRLLGVDIDVQAVALDVRAPRGFALTDHLRFTIGLRFAVGL